jgi:hypothetical protein
MDELRAEYKNAAEILTTMGYNGEMLDVEPVEVEEATIPADKEAQIEHLVASKLINKAGGLFKTGIIVANARVVLEGAKRVNAAEKEAKEAAVVKRGLVSKSREDEGVLAHLAWVKSGRPVTSDGYPKLSRKEALAIAKVLLPLIDIKQELKLKNFAKLATCVKWLGEIGRGVNWDA